MLEQEQSAKASKTQWTQRQEQLRDQKKQQQKQPAAPASNQQSLPPHVSPRPKTISLYNPTRPDPSAL